MEKVKYKDWREPLFECAVLRLEAGTLEELFRAEREFSFLGNYRNAKEQLAACRELLAKELERMEAEAVRARKLPALISAIRRLEAAAVLSGARQIPGGQQSMSGTDQQTFGTYQQFSGTKQQKQSGTKQQKQPGTDQQKQSGTDQQTFGAEQQVPGATQQKQSGANQQKPSNTAQQIARALQAAYEKKARMIQTKRRNRKVLRGLQAAAVCVALFMLLAVTLHARRTQRVMLEEAEKMAAAENFEGALGNYWRMLLGPYGDAAAEAIPENQRQLGYQSIEKGEFEQALKLFEVTGDAEGEKQAHAARGAAYLSEQNYEMAIKQYQLAEDSAGEQAVYFTWCKDLISEGAYSEAATTLRKAEDGEEKDALLSEIYVQRCEAALRGAQDYLKEAAEADRMNGQAADKLRDIGWELDDINSQLKYCELLDQAGIDPGEVYPDGVPVADVSLAAYQSRKIMNMASLLPGENLFSGKAVRALVFSRSLNVEKSSKYLRDSTIGIIIVPWDITDDSNYDIRLMPGELYDVSADRRAASLEESNLYLLADAGYQTLRYAELKKVMKMPSGGKTSKVPVPCYYPLLTEYDDVSIYEKDTPEHSVTIAAEKNETPWESGSMLEREYQIDDVRTYDFSRFWGESDPAFLKMALKEGVEQINEIKS
ncbi:MAG: hypothetical protein IJ860_05400 [Eubacterium sp.]|nr:hypothetical protein [Eubacterium sp.]